jgi:hypothetical protein
MILISHRGNINGKQIELENSVQYVTAALQNGYNVEVDVWRLSDTLYLGHDKPQYRIEVDWFIKHANKLWVHCKNIDSLCFFNTLKNNELNFFWHESDTATLTSKGYIWVYPGKQPVKNSVAVLPELYNESIINCLGVCSDNIIKYKV